MLGGIPNYDALAEEADTREAALMAPVGGVFTKAGQAEMAKESEAMAHDMNLGRAMIAGAGMSGSPLMTPLGMVIPQNQ